MFRALLFVGVQNILLASATFDLSVFRRMELKICRGRHAPLVCPPNQLLWVHEAVWGKDPITITSPYYDIFVCVAHDKDCQQVIADTDIIFRATSIRPYCVDANTRIRCYYNLLEVGISYILIYYSCIQEMLLDPIYMFSSTTRVTNTAHILLSALPEGEQSNRTEMVCHIHANEQNGNAIAATLTLVYIDLPQASSCSQKLWAKDQDDTQLFSVCSPTWLRQHTVYEGLVSWVALHFTSEPEADVSPVQGDVGCDSQPPPSLLIWIYLQAFDVFTITCGRQSGITIIDHTTGTTFSSVPVTQSNRWREDTGTASSPQLQTSPTTIDSTSPPPRSTSSVTPYHDIKTATSKSSTSNPPLPPSFTPTVTSPHGTETVTPRPPSRNHSSPSSSITTTPLGVNPGIPRSSSLPMPSSVPPSPTTLMSTDRELSSEQSSKSTTEVERNPQTAQHATLEHVTTKKAQSWEIAAISMGVVITVLLIGFAIVAIRMCKAARRRARLHREQEMLYYPDGFDDTLPNPMDGHNMLALAADAPYRPRDQEDLPDLPSAEGAVGGHTPMWMLDGNILDTASNISDPSYASLHF